MILCISDTQKVVFFSLQSLNKIIQRDFFPELSKLRAQHEYLDAVEHNDMEKLREISARYQVTQTPGGSLGEYKWKYWMQFFFVVMHILLKDHMNYFGLQDNLVLSTGLII